MRGICGRMQMDRERRDRGIGELRVISVVMETSDQWEESKWLCMTTEARSSMCLYSAYVTRARLAFPFPLHFSART